MATPRFDNTGGQPHEGEPKTPVQTKVVTANGTRDRELPGTVYDDLYLSMKDRKEMGIEGALLGCEVSAAMAENGVAVEGDRVVIGVRDPKEYNAKDKGRLRRLSREWESAEFVRPPGGDPYGHLDLLYVTVSREEYEKRQAAHDKTAKDFHKSVDGGEVSSQDGTLQEFRKDPETLEALKQQTHQKLRQSGMVQNWPGGMGYGEVLKHMGAEQTTKIEREAARGGRGEKAGEYEEYAARRAKGSKNRTISLPGRPTRATR